MIVLSGDNFEQEVLKSETPVLVDMWGPQCGPCLALMPEVEALAKANEGKIKFAKLNVAENRRLCITLKVMGVPTFLFYKGGECLDRITGEAVNIESIKAGVDKLLA